MSITVNMGNASLSLGDFDRVLKISEAALAAWNDSWSYSIARNGLYTNRAIAMANLGDISGALEGFRDVLRNARKEKVLQNEADALHNLGALFGMMNEGDPKGPFLDSSFAYERNALTATKALNDRNGVMILYSNLAAVASDRHEYSLALAYLDSASALTEELRDLGMAIKVEDQRSDCFFSLGQLDSAYHHLQLHLVLKDSLLNTEKVKAIADVQEKYESEKKARTIKELEVDQLASRLQQAQLKRTRNIYMFTGIGVLLLAGGLWNRLRFTRRSRAAIQKEKDISEGLLLNILPEEVAAELKAKGYADAREFEQATILFTDFKGFTSLSEKLTAGQLVAEIDHCFKAFDGIMEKYSIEKIKTIGDAYMAAGGLPIPENGSPADVIQAALEMQEFMAQYASVRQAEGRQYFEMRAGIHTGPVIAGIVGVKKFAYDIWGDTVNIASRMESSGEAGRVNISEATYALVREVKEVREEKEAAKGPNPQPVTRQPATAHVFTFTPRGKVQAKGKGEMEMYFVEKA